MAITITTPFDGAPKRSWGRMSGARDLVTALKVAEPNHKFEIYRALQLKLN